MKSKVLIIDDEKEIRELFKSFLEDDEDIELFEADNGQQAFNMVSNTQFDLYITDVFMPEMNGVEFLKILKMLDPDAVVIIITGYDNMECTRQALDYGAFRFLTKPVKMAEFKSIVELGLLERKKLMHTTTAEKLLRMKEKVNTNVELREKLFIKLQTFLLLMESKKPSYIEIGGPGSKDKVWGKFFSSFKPIPLDIAFSQDEINIMILNILSNEQLDKLLKDKLIRANFEFRDSGVRYRYRLIIYFEMDELVIGIKTTRRSLINLESMKFSSIALNKLSFKNENSGIVIISGPPGSGKSSLVDAIVNLNNTYLPGNIFIISDSIEYYHESKNSVVRQQELLRDVNKVNEALDHCLHFNPNMVVIEEVNNSGVFDNMIKLADTGCLVIGTMRNKSSVEVLYKLLSFYDPSMHSLMAKQLARSICTIVSLQLIPTPKNKMISLKEIMINNDQLMNVIGSGNIEEIYEIIQSSKKSGMQTLEQDLVNAVRSGLISSDTAIEHANNPSFLKNMLQFS